ncbi:helix-turn-helix domain-containing protein [Vibrio sp. C8]
MAVKTCSPISKLILLKLADNADSHGVCFPSCDYLAQYCEISLRTGKVTSKRWNKMALLSVFNASMKRGVREAICINCECQIIAMLNKATAIRRRGKRFYSLRGIELHP